MIAAGSDGSVDFAPANLLRSRDRTARSRYSLTVRDHREDPGHDRDSTNDLVAYQSPHDRDRSEGTAE